MKNLKRKLYKIDVAGKSAGRSATRIATILRGKHKPEYQPHVDIGDIVEVTGVDKLKFSGKKFEQKKYHRYSGYPGGLKSTKLSDLYIKNPGEVLRRSVREMLPPTRLRKGMMKRLIIR